jgi:hypothetical protein
MFNHWDPAIKYEGTVCVNPSTGSRAAGLELGTGLSSTSRNQRPCAHSPEKHRCITFVLLSIIFGSMPSWSASCMTRLRVSSCAPWAERWRRWSIYGNRWMDSGLVVRGHIIITLHMMKFWQDPEFREALVCLETLRRLRIIWDRRRLVYGFVICQVGGIIRRRGWLMIVWWDNSQLNICCSSLLVFGLVIENTRAYRMLSWAKEEILSHDETVLDRSEWFFDFTNCRSFSIMLTWLCLHESNFIIISAFLGFLLGLYYILLIN